MEVKYIGLIGMYLESQMKKAYKGGIKSVVTKNKKLIEGSFQEGRKLQEQLQLQEEWRDKILMQEGRNLIEVDWTAADFEALMNFRVECFTVAGVGVYELEEKLKKLAEQIQKGEHPLQKEARKAGKELDAQKLFEAEARKIMIEYIPIKDQPPGGWLKTNLNTAVASSYQAAQYNRLQDPYMKALYGYYMYMTMDDGKVRDEHMTLHGRIWRNDDPVWDVIWPPQGWNCRCRVEPMTADEVMEAGVEVENTGGDKEVIKKITKEGGIQKEFQRNSGQSRSIWGKWLDAKLSGTNWEEVEKGIRDFKMSAVVTDPRGQDDNIVKDFAGYFIDTKGLDISGHLTEPDEVWAEIIPGKIRKVTVRYLKGEEVAEIRGAEAKRKYKPKDKDVIRKGVILKWI
jgi:SPP1 gp7 family putative phage head morphogenesis protein